MATLAIDILNDDLLTIEETAQKLRITRRTFERYRKAGKAPRPILVNGKELYPISHINEFILQQNPHLACNEEVTNAAAAVIRGGR